ncbi:HNH endonuclease [Nostoc sp. CALU 546]|uniref:HNH endonuclease n=1 Tax=Nostoc sp. CALU 546 TaxID=1867241 RepID=UPI003B66D634
MSIDVKTLWGRSGNRCAFCKIELTPIGSKSTLGEMAHIVAKSPKGPRGQSNLTSEQRDECSNLILLCPTHHTLIDSNPEEWKVEKLKQIKAEHENWVSSQLENGRIYINKIDNSTFLKVREEEWIKFVGNHVWSIVSLTPLHISNDSLNPLNPDLLKSIHTLKLPQFYGYTSISDNINQFNTRPNEYGVINEELRHIEQYKFGHKIQVFRNSHCEFMICLEGVASSANTLSTRVLTYEDIALSFTTQINGLINIWTKHLELNDMLLTTLITNTTNTNLYSGKKTWNGYELGFTVTSQVLKYNKNINRCETLESVQESVIKRFVNYFGLNIDRVFGEDGKFNQPSKLY